MSTNTCLMAIYRLPSSCPRALSHPCLPRRHRRRLASNPSLSRRISGSRRRLGSSRCLRLDRIDAAQHTDRLAAATVAEQSDGAAIVIGRDDEPRRATYAVDLDLARCVVGVDHIASRDQSLADPHRAARPSDATGAIPPKPSSVPAPAAHLAALPALTAVHSRCQAQHRPYRTPRRWPTQRIGPLNVQSSGQAPAACSRRCTQARPLSSPAGRPVAVMLPVDAGRLDETLDTLRRPRAVGALRAIRREAKGGGLDKLSITEIDASSRRPDGKTGAAATLSTDEVEGGATPGCSARLCRSARSTARHGAPPRLAPAAARGRSPV